MDLKEMYGVGGVPVIVLLVQITKPFVEDERFWPWLSMAWGVGFNLVLSRVLGTDLAVAAVMGVLTGLIASGGWDAGKSLIKEPLEKE